MPDARAAVGRAVRVRSGRGDGGAVRVDALRLAARAVRHRRLPGARPRPAPGQAADRRRAHRHARGAGPARRRRRVGRVHADRGRRGRAHRARTRPDRAGRARPRRQAAGRPVAQRPGGDAVPDVAARRGPPGRRRRDRRRRGAAAPGRPAPGRGHAGPNAPAARAAGAARAPPAGPRPGAAAGRGPAAGLGPPGRGVAVRVGRARRLVARSRPGGGGRRAGLRRAPRRTPSTASRRGTSPRRSRSAWRCSG